MLEVDHSLNEVEIFVFLGPVSKMTHGVVVLHLNLTHHVKHILNWFTSTSQTRLSENVVEDFVNNVGISTVYRKLEGLIVLVDF